MMAPDPDPDALAIMTRHRSECVMTLDLTFLKRRSPTMSMDAQTAGEHLIRVTGSKGNGCSRELVTEKSIG